MSSYDDIHLELLDESDVREAIDNALAAAACTWEELQKQAEAGRFSSEVARRAWFVVSSLAEPAV